MRVYRDVCMECGHKETWREAIRSWWRMRKRPKQEAPFADIISASILEELRPSTVTREFLRRKP
jgi:hypothetical protein